MSTITREQLRERAREKVKSLEFAVTQTAFANTRAELEEELGLARIALASLEAEPVAVRARWKDEGSGHGNWKYYDIAHRDSLMADENRECELIYASQPAPASVPDEMTMQKALSAINRLSWQECTRDAYMHGWNACRVAMLQGADGNSPVIPDGWVACSEQMPESNKYVLVCNGVWVGMGLYNDGEQFEDCERWQDEHGEFIDLLHHPVSHWMQLPEAPQKEGE